jgi:hypothetical protein
MADYDKLLEPFAPQTLRAIQRAFHAGWSELSRTCGQADAIGTRNRLAGAIANLARKGIVDPHNLKDEALRVVNASRLASSRAPYEEAMQAEA